MKQFGLQVKDEFPTVRPKIQSLLDELRKIALK